MFGTARRMLLVLVPFFLLTTTLLTAAHPPSAAAVAAAPHSPGSTPVATFTVSYTPHTDLVSARRFVRVKPGATLSSMAARFYGAATLWPALWWTNRRTIANPNAIVAGERLRLSTWHPGKAWVLRRALAAIPAPPRPKPRRIRTYAAVTPPSDPPSAQAYGAAPGSFEACVIARESGGNPSAFNPSSGAGGLFQFLPSTWASLGFASSYPGGAQTAPPSAQYAAFDKLYAEAGTSPWAPYDGC